MTEHKQQILQTRIETITDKEYGRSWWLTRANDKMLSKLVYDSS